MTFTPADIVVGIALVIAATMDVWTARTKDGGLQRGKIPNKLTLPLMLIGIGMHTIEGDPLFALLGIAVAFAVHFPLWRLGIDGGGDAKLMMGVGALWGYNEMLETTWWTFVFFIPLGLIILAIRGRLKNLFSAALWSLDKAQGRDPGEQPPATFWPRGPVILLGAVAAFLGEHLDLFGA